MNAQISFLEGTFSLIHIPLDLYPIFLQPILQVLLPQGAAGDLRFSTEVEGPDTDIRHAFLNISITPIECSVVCHSNWAKTVFEPVVDKLPRDVAKQVTISKETYLVFSVISAGMDAGNRVMELTSPLALAGIPILFITTYYSDFILVPRKKKDMVVQALLARNFECIEGESAYVSSSPTNGRATSQGSEPPWSAPASSVAELQKRTFALLKKRSVVPYISEGLSLVQCSGRDVSEVIDYSSRRPPLGRQTTGNGHRTSWLDTMDTKLYTSLIAVLASQPKFLSITLALEDAPSLLLDKTLLNVFGDSLVGDTEGDLVPIILDLSNLPLEATGIVSGVAGKLVDEMHMIETGVSAELSYLSTARAGAVILSNEQSMKALTVLRPLLEK
ncbi:ACT domain-containing protein [Xylaria nigripes]|nr:ACT domain-containing protein [Xylaria nigripes]